MKGDVRVRHVITGFGGNVLKNQCGILIRLSGVLLPHNNTCNYTRGGGKTYISERMKDFRSTSERPDPTLDSNEAFFRFPPSTRWTRSTNKAGLPLLLSPLASPFQRNCNLG